MKTAQLSIITTLLISSMAFSSSLPTPESIRAYKNFWSGFDQYESKRLAKEKEEMAKAWDQLKQEYRLKETQLSDEQVAILKEGATKYRQHMQDHPEANNRPYVMLNLAQILNKIADHYEGRDQDTSIQYRSNALEILDSIGKKYSNFEKKEETLYLKASTQEALNRDQSALDTWHALSNVASKTTYGSHANIALGDHYFDRENAPKALKYYEKALKIHQRIASKADSFQLMRLQYRIAWAAYRSADLDRCIEAAKGILEPGKEMSSLGRQKSIEQDATDLIGDALYEINDLDKTKRIISSSILFNHSGAITLRILERYLDSRSYGDIIILGRYFVDKFPRARHIPDILTILADAFDAENNVNSKLEALEKLSLLLPRSSLWRSQYRNEFHVIHNMEKKAQAATELLAGHYYRIGMVNASQTSFMTASTYYESLIRFNSNHEKANDWRLKQANAFYFSDKIEEAKELYERLINQNKLDPKNLQIASYQLVLCFEKIWRQEYSRAMSNKQKPYDDPIVIQFLSNFEDAAKSFSDRFPSSHFNIEGLLKVASANRDMNKLERASKFWQRVLLSNPKPPQRAVAIRGLVYRRVHEEDNRKIIDTTTQFLNLENWQVFGSGLKNEIETILSTALRNESDQLNSAGKVHEAGTLLIEICQRFRSIPQSHDLYRDGVYMLAIAGDWPASLKYSQQALNWPRFKHKADLSYLKARSLEYQMRFESAANEYLSMAKNFPKHSRSYSALKKAETLALAENNRELAGEAHVLLASLSPKKKDKFDNYLKASEFFSDSGMYQKSLRYAKKAMAIAPSRETSLKSRLLRAKQRYALGSKEKALKEFSSISKEAQQVKDSMNFDEYSNILGESSFLLAEEARDIFSNFSIRKEKDHWYSLIKDKSELFEQLYAKYSTAIKSQHPLWASQSRYYLAQSAEDFSQEINEVLLLNDSISPRQMERVKDQASRFKKLAKRYYADNVAARNEYPKEYSNNPWVKKSIIKLTGLGQGHLSKAKEDRIPFSAEATIPQQWSL